ncbi:MAG TPA: hypothetical protein DCS82_07240 [Rhodospirillaceae bacterium]|nr:hypothetical protein [Rhodospirillaceae bacterium]HAT35493.1 hypothetical protein [Rhodospirillaceae bacterium]
MKTTRRKFLKTASGTALGAAALSSTSRIVLASAPTDRRLVFVILRGGLDGLALIPPIGDPNYRAARGSLAFNAPGQADGALNIDGYFGLHPSASPLVEYFQKGEIAAVQAVATPYRRRSHFQAQDILENGAGSQTGARDGWLNRAVQAMGGESGFAVAVGRGVPLVLQGNAPSSSWAPSKLPQPMPGFFDRVAKIYQNDPLLRTALGEGLKTRAAADAAMSKEDRRSGRGARKARDLAGIARVAGAFLNDEGGPRVAVLETSGWDTHANQGTTRGNLARRIGNLANGLATLAETMQPVWHKTAVVVISEFGRTVSPNGSGGTDHGTAGAALLMGGAINGPNTVTKWPGLARHQLHEGRDLMPTMDTRNLFKGVLAGHFGLSRRMLDNQVFPDSGHVAPIGNLIR